MKVKIKICGIRDLASALAAVESGADFLGFNFVPTSKRVIDPATAKEIMQHVKGRAIGVGVFQDQSLDEINAISYEVGLDCIQLHGSEDRDFCRQITSPVIKAFNHPDTFDVGQVSRRMEQYKVSYFLVDREQRGKGEMLSLERAAELATAFPLFFAGGLTPDNVSEVVRSVRPFAVDVASGVETDGDPDLDKIEMFVRKVKEINT